MTVTGYSTTANIVPPVSTAGSNSLRCLVIGQKDSIGTSPDGVLQQNINSITSAWSLFGRASHIMQGLTPFISIANQSRFIGKDTVILDAVAYNGSGSGVATIKTITLTGTSATSTVNIRVSIFSKFRFTQIIAINIGDTPTIIAGKIVAAFNALSSDIPFTIANSAGVITVTSTFTGTISNFIIDICGYASGISFALATTQAGSTNGIGSTQLNAIKALISNIKYDYIQIENEFLSSDTTFDAFLTSRINIVNGDVAGVALSAAVVNYSQAQTLIAAHNTVVGIIPVNSSSISNTSRVADTNALGELPIYIGCSIAAVRALTRVPNAIISDIMPNSGDTGGLGGPQYASIALSDVVIPTLMPININDQYSTSQLLTLAAKAIILENSDTGQNVVGGASRLDIATFAGLPTSLTSLANWDTVFTVRNYIYTNLKTSWKGKSLSIGTPTLGSKQISTSQAVRDIMNLVNILCTQDPKTGIVYALLVNDQALLSTVENRINQTITIANGILAADIISNIVNPLESAILSLLISNS